jgi:hypothetical protein
VFVTCKVIYSKYMWNSVNSKCICDLSLLVSPFYELIDAASEYTAHIPHLFMDPAERDHVSELYLLDLPKPDHPTPTINVVEIR